MDEIMQTEGKTALELAIDAMGTQQALADALGIKSPSITEWRDRKVPAERCIPIEEATCGAVTRYELRPDVFGPAPAQSADSADKAAA
jgi:DNA-binding transcriptional regulator YdaS (Cro superfamily)